MFERMTRRPIRRVVLLAGATAVLGAAEIYPAQERRAAAQTGYRTAISDQRAPIVLTDEERAFIFREMRGLLESIGDILEASEAGDRARVAAAARRSGMNGPEAEHIPKSLGAKLPPEFKKLGLATHRAFDQIALDADQFGDGQVTRRQLVELMRNCTACHATWRLAEEDKR
jgi:hypothetical protein